MNKDELWKRMEYGSPRCLATIVREEDGPRSGDYNSWRLSCPCGHRVGNILGHRLGVLKPDFEDWDWLVSPIAFRCQRCDREAEILDTAQHGFASECFLLDGQGFSCVAYRGEGAKTSFRCPTCQGTGWEVTVALTYDLGAIADVAEDEQLAITQPMDFFDRYELTGRCPHCGMETIISNIHTK